MTSKFQINPIQKQITYLFGNRAVHPFDIIFLKYLSTPRSSRSAIFFAPDRFGNLFYFSGTDTMNKHLSNGTGDFLLPANPSVKKFGYKIGFASSGNGNVLDQSKPSLEISVSCAVTIITSFVRSLIRPNTNKFFKLILNLVNNSDT